MFRVLTRAVVITFVVFGVIALCLAVWFAASGISARRPPGRLESAVATRLRSWAIPPAARNRQNPIPASANAVAEGLAHFADHCAVCHANDGRGDTEMGRGLYPPAPDMRGSRTQSLSDGELFYIIENGVKLTGMPAWGNGSPESEHASWQLVQFIRHLPRLSEDELAQMERLNPKSSAEWQEEEEARKVLNGPKEPSKPAPTHTHRN